jgi:hypothetical protein
MPAIETTKSTQEDQLSPLRRANAYMDDRLRRIAVFE